MKVHAENIKTTPAWLAGFGFQVPYQVLALLSAMNFLNSSASFSLMLLKYSRQLEQTSTQQATGIPSDASLYVIGWYHVPFLCKKGSSQIGIFPPRKSTTFVHDKSIQYIVQISVFLCERFEAFGEDVRTMWVPLFPTVVKDKDTGAYRE